ncbi:Swi5-domain-containing protein [Trametes meyenii]|nr:Swi5-domain-containing protein [Trametes meyenii]
MTVVDRLLAFSGLLNKLHVQYAQFPCSHSIPNTALDIAPPCATPVIQAVYDARQNAQQARIEALQAEVKELQKTLGEGENAEQIVSKHIKLLHRYNEAKDATQILIGKLAAYRQATIRQVHNDFGLTDED